MLSPIINDPLTVPGGTHTGVSNGTSVYGPEDAMLGTCLLTVKEHRSLSIRQPSQWYVEMAKKKRARESPVFKRRLCSKAQLGCSYLQSRQPPGQTEKVFALRHSFKW